MLVFFVYGESVIQYNIVVDFDFDHFGMEVLECKSGGGYRKEWMDDWILL